MVFEYEKLHLPMQLYFELNLSKYWPFENDELDDLVLERNTGVRVRLDLESNYLAC